MGDLSIADEAIRDHESTSTGLTESKRSFARGARKWLYPGLLAVGETAAAGNSHCCLDTPAADTGHPTDSHDSLPLTP